MSLTATLFPTKYFPDGTSSMNMILLPINVIRDYATTKPPMMDGFHSGIGELQTKKMEKELMVECSAEHPEKMFAFVKRDRMGLIVFGRKGLTNWAETRIPLLSEDHLKRLGIELEDGLWAYCSEQIFKLLCTSAHYPHGNVEEITGKILSASIPLNAKLAPTN